MSNWNAWMLVLSALCVGIIFENAGWALFFLLSSMFITETYFVGKIEKDERLNVKINDQAKE